MFDWIDNVFIEVGYLFVYLIISMGSVDVGRKIDGWSTYRTFGHLLYMVILYVPCRWFWHWYWWSGSESAQILHTLSGLFLAAGSYLENMDSRFLGILLLGIYILIAAISGMRRWIAVLQGWYELDPAPRERSNSHHSSVDDVDIANNIFHMHIKVHHILGRLFIHKRDKVRLDRIEQHLDKLKQ